MNNYSDVISRMLVPRKYLWTEGFIISKLQACKVFPMFIPTCGKLKSQGVQCIICNYKKWVQLDQRTAPRGTIVQTSSPAPQPEQCHRG